MPVKRALLLLLAIACARAKPKPFAPDPDAMEEATRIDLPDTYVSARAYQHYLDALLARSADDLPAAADELREALIYDPESPHLHTVLADVRLKQGRVSDAEDELKQALAIDANHAPAHLLLARIAEARQKPDEALMHLKASINAAPGEPDAYRELVRVQLLQGDLDSARQTAAELSRQSKAAQKVQPDEDGPGTELVAADRLRIQAAGAWVDLARAYEQHHDAASAQKAFDEALGNNPSDWDAITAEGSFKESQRDFEAARQLYLRLLAQRPESPEVLAALARLALEEGDLETVDAHAKKLLGLAADLDPSGPDSTNDQEDDRRDTAGALLRVAVSLLGAHRSAAAQSAIEGALRLYPDQPELHFYKAMALTQRGRPRDGALAFEQVVKRLSQSSREINPSFLGVEPKALLLDARVQAALARGRAGETGESLQRLKALFAAQPQDESTSLAILEGYDRAGKPAEAEALLAAAAKAHPGSEALLYALANAQDRLNERDKAVATMRKLLTLAPDHSGALNYIGYTLTEKGRAAEAKPLLARAVELRPDDGAVADSYGYCLLQLGQKLEALDEIERADRLSPGDPVILSHLGDALLAIGRKDEARETFRKALARFETPPKPAKKALRANDVSSLAADPPDRLPDPGDEKVRKDLEGKLRSLSQRP